MSDKKISELTSTTSLNDADVFPLVQENETKKINVYNLYNAIKSEINKYSLNEIKIGTWIDGKPLYRKTITGTFLSDDSYTNILTNINVVFFKSGILYESSTTIRQLEYYNNNNNDFDVVNINHTVKYRAKSSSIQGKNFIFTIEYTKTTD